MTLQDFMTLLRRGWWIVAIGVVLGGLLGFAYESTQPKVVATDGRLLIAPSVGEDLDVIDSTGALSRGTLQQTLAAIVTGSEVTGVARADVGNTSNAYTVTSGVIPETNVVRVGVEGPNGDEAKALAEAIMARAETNFESLYVVYDISVVDQPDTTIQVAPNPELGLMIGVLLGAFVASIGLVVADGRRSAADAGDDVAGSRSPGIGARLRAAVERLLETQGQQPGPVVEQRTSADAGGYDQRVVGQDHDEDDDVFDGLAADPARDVGPFHGDETPREPSSRRHGDRDEGQRPPAGPPVAEVGTAHDSWRAGQHDVTDDDERWTG